MVQTFHSEDLEQLRVDGSVAGVRPVQISHIPTLEDLLKAGVHFGHRTSKWYPKAKPFIHSVRAGVHVIDLEQSQKGLKKACEFLGDISAHNGTILFVGTKKQAKKAIIMAAKKAQMPYVTERWLGGTFTNFHQIVKLGKRFRELQALEAGPDFQKYTKKEQAHFADEKAYLEKKVGGILGMERLPQAVVIVGLNEEETAVREAISAGIPIVALVDTNTDPTPVHYPIPANDDAVKSIEIILMTLADTIVANQK